MNITNNKIYSEIHLDVYSNDIKVINAQQGDKKSRFIKIYVTAMNEPVQFKNNISAVLKGHRADGEMIYDDCQIIDNYILVELKDYILCVAGECEFNIGLYGSDDSLLSTITFKVFVDKNPYDENVIIASPTFSALTEALNKVNKALKDTEDAINKINNKIDEVTVLENNIKKDMADFAEAEKKREEAEKAREEKANSLNDAIDKADKAADRANDAADKAEEIAESYKNANEIFIPKSEINVPNGIPSLDENGKVPLEQLPDGIGDGSGAGIYVSEIQPETIKVKEHWFKIINTLDAPDYSFLLSQYN